MILLFIVGGVFALGLGADMIVRSAINLANIYKISGYFIGFTVVALGTSLPELAATVQAISVTDSIDIALGNIIGSNIANILLILGVVSIINPIIFSEKKGQKNQGPHRPIRSCRYLCEQSKVGQMEPVADINLSTKSVDNFVDISFKSNHFLIISLILVRLVKKTS